MTKLPGALAALTGSIADLGLQPGRVQLRVHDQRWAGLYQQIATHLTGAVDDLGAAVEHIGSTAVPGLAAKPILDIAVGAIAPIDTDVYVARLEDVGFAFQTDLGLDGGLLFFATTDSGRVVAHLHVVDIDDFQWRWYLAFRDVLRSDQDLRADYELVKQQSATTHADDREKYTQAKSDWILNTVQSIDPQHPAGLSGAGGHA